MTGRREAVVWMSPWPCLPRDSTNWHSCGIILRKRDNVNKEIGANGQALQAPVTGISSW